MLLAKRNNVNKGRVPWNKGLKGYLAGEKNPMYGKTHTKEAIAKIIDANIGRKASEETRKKQSESHKNLKPSSWGAGFKEGNIPWNKASWKNAYFAGLIDGEGAIGIQNNGSIRNNKGEKYKRVIVRISLVNSRFLLEEGKELWGGWIYLRERSKKNPKHSDADEWIVQHGCAERLLQDILPYLRLKKRQAEIVLEYRKLQNKKRTVTNQITEKELEYRKKLEFELKSLKLKKGKQLDVII